MGEERCVCVRFPRILLREDMNLTAGILVAMGEGWGHNSHSLENRSFNFPLLFFHPLHALLSSRMPVAIESGHWKGQDNLSFLWVEVEIWTSELSLRQNFNRNFLFYDLFTWPLLKVPSASFSGHWVSLAFTGTKPTLLCFHVASLDCIFLWSVKLSLVCWLSAFITKVFILLRILLLLRSFCVFFLSEWL